MTNLSQYCLRRAASARSGLALPYQEIESLAADIPEFYNVAVPFGRREGGKQAANGGIARTRDGAIDAGVAESLERYAGSTAMFPIFQQKDLKNSVVLGMEHFALFTDAQYSSKDFHHKKPNPEDVWYGEVFSLNDNSPVWIPEGLIGLGSRAGVSLFPSTSTGLAAGKNIEQALLSGLEEVLERDALTAYWLSALPGRELLLDDMYSKSIIARGGDIHCFDITQSWNPYPVVVVTGGLPLRGVQRISLGAACRASYSEAVEKAFAEWVQGVIFAGYFTHLYPNSDGDVRTFEDHAAYYTMHPDKWTQVPIMRKRTNHTVEEEAHPFKNPVSLSELLIILRKAGLEAYYRDITPADVHETGVVVVRVVVPGLAYLHGDEQEPFLGGRTGDVAWRYGNMVPLEKFPSPYPHPLG